MDGRRRALLSVPFGYASLHCEQGTPIPLANDLQLFNFRWQSLFKFGWQWTCDYDVVSVNLCSGLQDGQMAYVDTNNIPEIDRWLVKNGIAEDTGVRTVSGFCTYPLLQFNQVKEEVTL